MGFFSTGDPQAIHRLSERVSELENAVLLLKTSLKCKTTEWDDVLDKITKQTERMRKRSNTFIQDAQEGPENRLDVSQDPQMRHRLLADITRAQR